MIGQTIETRPKRRIVILSLTPLPPASAFVPDLRVGIVAKRCGEGLFVTRLGAQLRNGGAPALL
jgi:hypothetical protein